MNPYTINLTKADELRRWFGTEMGTRLFYSLEDKAIMVLGCRLSAPSCAFLLIGDMQLNCVEGSARCTVGDREYRISRHDMLILLNGSRVRIDSVSTDFQFKIFMMSRDFSESLLVHNTFATYLSALENPLLSLNEEQWLLHEEYERLITYNMEHYRPFSVQVVKRLEETRHYQFPLNSKSFPTGSRTEDLTLRFEHLLQLEYLHHRDVSFYADRLCVTPKYLTECIKKASGYTASEWIDSRIMHDAEYLLSNLQLSIQQISAQLGFENQSAFGKFFKRIYGLSPSAYRDKLSNA